MTNDAVFRFRLPSPAKEQFQEQCARHGVDGSVVLRNVVRALARGEPVSFRWPEREEQE